MLDIFEEKNLTVKIGDHGVVSLLDAMPRLVNSGENFDHAVLQAARVSYGADSKKGTDKENRGLIRYLMRHNHGTPFEMVDLKFYMSLPIFVARQLIRHRTASINEYSMRYKQPKERFYLPALDNVRKQSKTNKQGSVGQVETDLAQRFVSHTQETFDHQFGEYNEFEAAGIGRELARINLPLSTFTEWIWEIDLRNLLGFLGLRMDSHAQKEIRDYANAMYEIIAPMAPWTIEAFDDFEPHRGAILLTALEVEAMRGQVSHLGSVKLSDRATDREKDEWGAKLKRLNGEAV